MYYSFPGIPNPFETVKKDIIINEVSKYFNRKPKEYSSKNLSGDLRDERKLLYYLLYSRTRLTFAKIGIILGFRGSDTIQAGIKSFVPDLATKRIQKAFKEISFNLELKNIYYVREKDNIEFF